MNYGEELCKKLSEINMRIMNGEGEESILSEKACLEHKLNTLNVNKRNTMNVKEFAKKVVVKEHNKKKCYEEFMFN